MLAELNVIKIPKGELLLVSSSMKLEFFLSI